MNQKELCKHIGAHVRLCPPVKRFEGGIGRQELEQIDTHWRIDGCRPEGLVLSNVGSQDGGASPHVMTVGFDHIRNFSTDPMNGKGHGLLTLCAQYGISGNVAEFMRIIKP